MPVGGAAQHSKSKKVAVPKKRKRWDRQSVINLPDERKTRVVRGGGGGEGTQVEYDMN